MHKHPRFDDIAFHCTQFPDGSATRRIIKEFREMANPNPKFLERLLELSVHYLSPGSVLALLEAGAPFDIRCEGMELEQYANQSGKNDPLKYARSPDPSSKVRPTALVNQIKKDLAAFRSGAKRASPALSSKQKRPAIPQAQRAELWKRFYGDENEKPKCICCLASQLEFNEHGFEAAHIIARTYCKHDELWNLIPVCGQCNNVNRTENLFDWFFRKWPERLLSLAERVTCVNESPDPAPIYIETKFHIGVEAGGISNATLAALRAEERHEKRYRELEERMEDRMDAMTERIEELEGRLKKSKQTRE